jgi:hypothetical protein
VNDRSEHIAFDLLNDYVDDRLDKATVGRVTEHVRGCAQCSDELADLRRLVSGVGSLPREVLPTEDLWTDLKASIDSRKHIVLPTGHQMPQPDQQAVFGAQSAWRTRLLLAIAAVVLVVVSSSITAIVLRSGNVDMVDGGSERRVLPQDISVAPVLPASFAVAEGKYVITIEELKSAFHVQRSSLNPETVRTVEHSLAVIDSAIAEARDALLADPGNRTLVDLLSASYQRKLDLLRRTSELTPRT